MSPSGFAADCLMTLEYDMSYGGYQNGQLLLKVVSRLFSVLKIACTALLAVLQELSCSISDRNRAVGPATAL